MKRQMEMVERTFDEEEAYQHWVGCRIMEVAAQGTVSFRTLISSLPSVYPAVALKAAQRLAASGIILVQQSERWIQEAGQKPHICLKPPIEAGLPVPHPLDYEWRFCRRTGANLLETCLRLTGAGDTIALLGVPSLLREVALQKQSKRKFVLFDANEQALNALAQAAPAAQLVHWNVACDDLPSVSAQCVVVDAPWYPEYIQAFLRAASQLCMRRGHILVSFPSAGTRPGIIKERNSFLEEARNNGLRLVQWNTSAFVYDSPLFERNALRAEGVTNYPRRWRRGDMAVFVFEGESLSAQPPIIIEREQWSEYALQGVRIRVRQRKELVRVPTIVSVVPGDILSSVSRRDPRRNQADVWTTGNRIFRCDASQGLQLVLNALANDRSPHIALKQALKRHLIAAESATLDRTVSRLAEIIEVERSEMTVYGA